MPAERCLGFGYLVPDIVAATASVNNHLEVQVGGIGASDNILRMTSWQDNGGVWRAFSPTAPVVQVGVQDVDTVFVSGLNVVGLGSTTTTSTCSPARTPAVCGVRALISRRDVHSDVNRSRPWRGPRRVHATARPRAQLNRNDVLSRRARDGSAHHASLLTEARVRQDAGGNSVRQCSVTVITMREIATDRGRVAHHTPDKSS